MPPNKRIHDKTLTLVCEWSSCHESFSQMDHFCNHAETHFDALNAAQEDEEETEGEEFKYYSPKWQPVVEVRV